MHARVFVTLAAVLMGAPALAASAAPSLSQTFKRVGGAVVVVRTTERVLAGQRSNTHEVRARGLGSGVLISTDGKVLTAAHVVQTADAVAVEFPGDTLIKASIVASDPAADVALLQLERVPAGVQPATLGDSDKAEVGDEIFIVGAPLGISHTLTVGHVSARRRPNATFGSMETTELFQTDAAINEGNSGGPMFNLAGEVIGVVSRIVSRSGGSEGLGFVVTSNMARRSLFAEPTVWSGLEGYLLTDEMARVFNVPVAHAGLLVQRVAHGSPAERLGLRGGDLPAVIAGEEMIVGGDIVLAVDGVALGEQDAYESIRKRMIEIRDHNGPLHLTLLRSGVIVELSGSVEP
ncbi:MAG: trypsin [Lysobacterales bacterium]|nr:MAG: trypsin [Xanthomonadales bacterium]